MTAINIVDRRTPGTPEMINDEITGGEAFGKPALELVHEQLAGSVEPFTLPDDPDADVIADLAAIGIDFSGGTLTDVEIAADQAKREAVAATFLDHAGRHATRADELMQARDHQLAILLAKGQRIRDFYERQIQKQNARRDELLRHVEHLAALSVYTGKKKSIDTPFGTFGFKDVSPSVELVDEAAALEWAKGQQPALVQVTAKLALTEAVEYLSDTELASCKQTLKWGELKKTLTPEAKELPPGVQKVDGGRQFYAKIDR
jgi:hypothetical protein